MDEKIQSLEFQFKNLTSPNRSPSSHSPSFLSKKEKISSPKSISPSLAKNLSGESVSASALQSEVRLAKMRSLDDNLRKNTISKIIKDPINFISNSLQSSLKEFDGISELFRE